VHYQCFHINKNKNFIIKLNDLLVSIFERMKPIALISLMIFCVLTACHKSAPEIPWENFDRYHIDEKLSEKGPYNNYRLTFWKADSGTYRAEVLADFAARYGWKLNQAEKMDKGFVLIVNQIYRRIFKKKDETLPRWFNDSCYVYHFVPPIPSADKRTKTAYDVFVSPDKSQICVYNVLW